MTAQTALNPGTARVWTSAAGAPSRLVWNGRRFVVVSKPIPWMARDAWWETAARAPMGEGAEMVNRPMWQVQARALEDGELLIFDLAVTQGPVWPVTGIFD
ncbi:DUF6504 family protein [Falsarthrobacter nasiphocae]|uniref:Uncharacterized protein n=1 Tax=Falsarthrobacter nasiphocae TaxID=189863 RepID=A0AAE4C602_9MICC|nr:DUF6504 family protein [Falsarthrobacter nasiphocae]MDR6891607.1 hypothetical protein [Falsarthrobacter nasiphocae]